MKKTWFAVTAFTAVCGWLPLTVLADGNNLAPLMGWSSWNTFSKDITEPIILGCAQAIATNGLKDAGYAYVNIDDGFFGKGHDENGNLRFHPKRFPNGLKATVDGIHALGLKAGIYSDAGKDTCGSMWSDHDGSGCGSGLYGHDAEDLKLFFNELGFDFIKVDYCGAERQKLDERIRYTEIANSILATGRKDIRLNVCRWCFPGTWVTKIAESWRTTYDIRANWKSMRNIIAENLYLSAYASPGHYNDLDMLEVGHLIGVVKPTADYPENTGITEDEEVTQFGMWCMLSSPLLIGCDVRNIPASTLRLVTNPLLIAMNQNNGIGQQGYVVSRDHGAYVLVKDAEIPHGKSRYVALYNSSDEERSFTVNARTIDLGGRMKLTDLVERRELGEKGEEFTMRLKPHASRFLRVDADERLERTLYEAETAFLTDYQELKDAIKAGTAFSRDVPGASGGVAVVNLGNRSTNDLIWKDVMTKTDGKRTLALYCSSPESRTCQVEVDGKAAGSLSFGNTEGKFVRKALEVELKAGHHVIRLSNPTQKLPDVDKMEVVL